MEYFAIYSVPTHSELFELHSISIHGRVSIMSILVNSKTLTP